MTARSPILGTLLVAFAFLAGGATADGSSFVTFETGQVRPLALSPDDLHLYAVNTPDDRLEIFDTDAQGNLTHSGSVPVGLEPIAAAAHGDGRHVWVVNHLSDSVSIVDVSSSPPCVVRTLLVGDEPRDIVFAGPGGNRAFITTAHLGQNSGVPLADFTTEGIGRADVWVFDVTNLGSVLGGSPLTKLTLFGDTPRALAASPDGNTVYAAVFQSGNQTTALNEGLVCDGGSTATSCTVGGSTMPGGLPAPNVDCFGNAQPEPGMIVRFNPAHNAREDGLGRQLCEPGRDGEGEEPRHAARHGGHARWRDALRRGVRLERRRRVQHGPAREQHLRPERREPHRRQRRRAERARAAGQPPLRFHALRQRDLDRRHGEQRRDRSPDHPQSRTGVGHPGPAAPLRCRRDLRQRRGLVLL